MQYIDLEKLKPALEGVEGLGVDVLESILGLAETNEFVDRTPEIEELKAQIEELNTTHASELESAKADFEARYRQAFFHGVEQPTKDEESEPEELTVEKLLEDILGE
jgi:hypothetical protein